MTLTSIVLPTRCTTCRTCNSIVDTILIIHRTYAFETVVSNHVVTEYVEILLNHRTEILAESLHVLNEVRIDISLKTTDTVIILDQATTSCLLHHVQHVLTVTHTVEECSQSTQVLCGTTEVQQVRVDTLQLIHDSTDVVDTIRKFDTHSLLDNAYQSVAVHHGREVVQTVGQSQSLRISHILPHLLNTTVDISEVRINALHGLTVDNGLKTEHTMGRWVVRTDVDNILIIIEATLFCSYQMTISTKTVFYCEIILWLISTRELIGLWTHIEILAQRIALEISTEEKTTHIRVTQELDADEIKHLTLQQISNLPEIDDCRNHIRTIHLLGDSLDRATFVSLSIFKNIDTSETFLTEVFTDDGNKVVEMLLVLQLRHFRGEIIKTQFNIIQFHVLIPYYINQLDLSEGRNPQVLQLR